MRASRQSTLSLLGITGLCLAAALSGYWLSTRFADPASEAPAIVGFALPDIDGRRHTPVEWRGKVVLLNFWATWGAPCRDEIPLLLAMQTHYAPRGLQVIGIALDDPDAVRRYGDELGINYPSLVAPDTGPALIARFGGRGVLPFSVFLDRAGDVRETHHGEFSSALLEAAIQAAL